MHNQLTHLILIKHLVRHLHDLVGRRLPDAHKYFFQRRDAAEIEDPSVREQWRFHVLYSAGDLSSALSSSLAAVSERPADRELLGNAAIAATALGQGALADDLCRRWRAAIEAQTSEPEQRAALLRKADEVAVQAGEAARVDAAAQSALGAARAAALALLASSCAALAALARWRRLPETR